MNQTLYVILGLVAGIFAGIFGIGGGSIMIPALVYLAGFTQHQAQGTTLAAMVPPIGLLAALRYWQSGNVKLSVAALICAGFFVGGFIGAHFIQNVPDQALKKAFGIFLLIVSLNMILGK
ncbi:MAG: sulfite exporter TauE/SafE family protein [Candidatus Omnitrophota bacterium]|jgi:hypothetical protein